MKRMKPKTIEVGKAYRMAEPFLAGPSEQLERAIDALHLAHSPMECSEPGEEDDGSLDPTEEAIRQDRRAGWSEVVKRRFGSRHEKPCADPSMLTCASAECQIANRCRLNPAKPAGRRALQGETS